VFVYINYLVNKILGDYYWDVAGLFAMSCGRYSCHCRYSSEMVEHFEYIEYFILFVV